MPTFTAAEVAELAGPPRMISVDDVPTGMAAAWLDKLDATMSAETVLRLAWHNGCDSQRLYTENGDHWCQAFFSDGTTTVAWLEEV